VCETKVPLMDDLEKRLDSRNLEDATLGLEAQATQGVQREALDLILTGHALAVADEAGQIFRARRQPEMGVDAEIEFKDGHGEPSGRKVLLVFGSDDQRSRRDLEPGAIENARRRAERFGGDHLAMRVMRAADGQIRWTNATSELHQQPAVREQLDMESEAFTALSLARLITRLSLESTMPAKSGRASS